MNELRTKGVVIGHNPRPYYGDVLIHPVVRFEAQDGGTVEFESESGSNVPPGVGEEVEVIYDSRLPEAAKLSPGSTLRFGPRALMVAGVLVFGAALLFFL